MRWQVRKGCNMEDLNSRLGQLRALESPGFGMWHDQTCVFWSWWNLWSIPECGGRLPHSLRASPNIPILWMIDIHFYKPTFPSFVHNYHALAHPNLTKLFFKKPTWLFLYLKLSVIWFSSLTIPGVSDWVSKPNVFSLSITYFYKKLYRVPFHSENYSVI